MVRSLKKHQKSIVENITNRQDKQIHIRSYRHWDAQRDIRIIEDVICKSTHPETTSLQWNNLPKPTSLPSTVATFLATNLMAVLQSSRYSVFHSGDTPIQLSLPWQSYSCQCLNTETSAWGNRSVTTKIPSIFYIFCLYIRLVVTL